ncbi:hypothetical protein Ndes2526B_g08600 [Nannochloris sp. 'desiccata']|nr:hypothetical protein KSW81_001806 [Chlorella desiccata (nom. nud.)]KAH7616244.1 hypothetical protein NADE_001070 [Chlorella desiccata (nom. nud.)]KAH7616511.1 hypothetical protein NADE_001326 [Chlorella desiccata (nom. nud.)]
MQTCAQQLMAATCSVQPCARKSVVARASISFTTRTERTIAPAAKPFGTASLPRRNAMHVAQAAQTDGGVGKLISKVEIPAFIPRQDLMDQLLRWAVIEIQENGMGNVGCPCKVTPYKKDGTFWGFTVSFLKDGASATDIRVAFDDEVTQKHEWIGRGADGFPTLEGNAENVDGKNFEVRKVDDVPATDAVRSSVRDFCQMLVAAINKYYAFGSCFVDDAT